MQLDGLYSLYLLHVLLHACPLMLIRDCSGIAVAIEAVNMCSLLAIDMQQGARMQGLS